MVDGLNPDTQYQMNLTWSGGSTSLSLRTLRTPPGPLLAKIATVSDLHIGARRWGASKLMVDTSGHPVPPPTRCARAAITEAIEWGAELLIIKGDAVHHQDASHFSQLGDLLDEFPQLPMILLPGNHDVDQSSQDPVPTHIGNRKLSYVSHAETYDIDGITVIGANTTMPGRGRGTVGPIAESVCELTSSSSQPTFVALHHQLQLRPIPTHYPLGVPRAESRPFLKALAKANPQTLVSSGHTHRNRRQSHGTMITSEVAATRDWPGVWAGYSVHSGGISQLVRRVSAPDAIVWHEYSRRALFGIWGSWSSGPIDQRCFSHRWDGD